MPGINTYAGELLIEFADSIHAELRRVLTKEFGERWLTQGVRKHFKEEQFARVQEMLQNPMRVVEMQKAEDEIHGLEHFWQIINGNWQIFKDYFLDRKRAEVFLQEITELRHNLSHRMGHHVLLKSDLIRILGNCRIVLSALESPNSDKFAEVVDSLIAGGSPWGRSLDGHLPPSDEIYSEFVGRPGELNELSAWLASDSPQVLVWGYGGAGKSALAYRFARDVKEGTGEGLIAVGWVSAKKSEYVEGIVKERSADFGDMDSLVAAIWSALYGADDLPETLEPAALVRELKAMPMLLVVDDFDTISEDEALSEFLLYELRNTPTRVIYTSRHRVPGMRNLEVPPFTVQELEEFVSNRAEVYGSDGELCLKRVQGVMSVTNGYPLFVDDLIHHAALVGVDVALQDWGQRRGDAAREYALRRQVEYLGHSSGEVLIALAIANRALIPVEISNIAGLTDADVEAGLRALLTWRMVNQATVDGSPSPAYRMNANTSRLVHQTYREDNRIKTFSASFSALNGERVPEAKKYAIGKVINRTKEIFSNHSFASARDHLLESMTGELADSPDLYGVLGWLYSNQQPLESYYEPATKAFDRSQALGSSKIDTYYHWLIMEKNVAESMIEIAQDIGLTNDTIAQQWKSCERVAEMGLRRCGTSQLFCYWAGYAASREAKAREYAQNFTYAQGAYARSKDWLEQALNGPVSDVATVPRGSIYRGLVLACDGLGNLPELRRNLLEWFRFSGPSPFLQTEYRRMVKRHPSLWDVPELRQLLSVPTF